MTRTARPSEQRRDLETAIRQLSRFADQLDTIVANLRDWSTGISGNSGPRPKNTVSDPTGQTALATDEWGQMRHHIAELILRVYRASCDLNRIRQQVADIPPPKEPEQRGLAHCANPNCPDDAWAVKAGRCEPCYRYRLRTDRDRRKSKEPNASDENA